jgi:predicted permease
MLRFAYRFALLACPRPVRRVRGAEMEEIFLFCVAARSRQAGVAGAFGAIARGFADLLAFAWSVRTTGAEPDDASRQDSSAHQPSRPPIMRRQDVLATLRFMRRQPLFAGAIVLMLALGLGATTALFSVVYGVLLKPLPFPDAGRIVAIYASLPTRGWDHTSLTEANVWDLAELNHTLSDMGAWHGTAAVLIDGTAPERVDGALVSSGLFKALGVQPVVGRLFSADDDKPGAEGASRPVLLSFGLWQRRYAGDPSIVGRTIGFSSGPRTVIGVLPAGTPWLDSGELFFPLVRRTNPNRGSFEYAAVGRLKPGVTMDAALADLQSVSRTLAQRYPESNTGLGVGLHSSDAWVASSDLRRTLWILLGAVGLLLVIACVNVTNLLLARAAARARESAVRTALGASRVDLVREWLVESLTLSALSMLVGLAIAKGLLQVVAALGPADISRLNAVALDGWVFVAASVLTLAVGVVTGLVPAFQTPMATIVGGLRGGQRGAVGDRRQDRLRQIFVAAEVALCLILLVGAGLLVRSLFQILSTDRGFSSDHRLLATVTIPAAYGDGRIAEIDQQVMTRVKALPQVVSAAFVSGRPLSSGSTGLGFGAADAPDSNSGAVPWATWRYITPEYFKTMGVPVLEGRTFEPDETDKLGRTIVSRRIADMLWPGQSAIGRTIILWKRQSNRRAQVIGVVGNMRERGLENDPTMAVYLPLGQTDPWGELNLVIRTSVEPTAIVPDLRTTVAAVDPHVPLSNIHQLDDAVATSVATRRFTMLLLAAFAALALLLALAGVGGVLAYAVARRTPEFGLRLALGAEPRRLVRFILMAGLRPVLVGLAVGLVAAFGVSRLMSSLLFGITPSDPITYATVSLGVILTTMAACYVPARRVLGVDPAISLRTE